MNEIQSLIGRLKEHSKNCEDKCLDLKTLKFDVHEGEMKLFNQSETYYFKYDPKNPRDPKITHAAQQFCKMMGVPFSFFSKNPEHMRKQLVECWLPTLKTEESQVLGKLRRSTDYFTIRALLPVEFTNISNAEVIESVANAIGDSFRMEFAIGDERDDLVSHVRFISTEEFDACGEKCSVGFSVIASELGAAPLTVDTLLYRIPSKSSFIANYNSEGFFQCDYEKIQPSALQELFPNLVTLLKNQLKELRNKVQTAKELTAKTDDIQELLKNLRLRKGLNEKFHTLLFQEIEKDSSVKNRWDFTNKISILAKDFDVTTRVRIEKIAGDLIGLIFEKV